MSEQVTNICQQEYKHSIALLRSQMNHIEQGSSNPLGCTPVPVYYLLRTGLHSRRGAAD